MAVDIGYTILVVPGGIILALLVALGLNKVRGRFNRVSGTVQIANPPEQSTVQVTIQTASVSTGVRRRDDHLRSADFLDVGTYPEMRFVSTGQERTRSKP